MANSAVTLMRRVKTDNGWRYYPAAYAANGRVIPGVVMVAGEEMKHKTGFYGLRFYRGSKVVFEPLKNATAVAAESARARREAQFSAAIHAKKEGIKIVPIDPQRLTLASQLNKFLADTVDRGSMEAAEVYELACREFLEVVGRKYAEEIVPDDILNFQKALQKRGMSSRTVSNRHSSVKAFLRSIGYNTKELPKPPKYDKTLPEIYTDQELEALFQAVTSPKASLLFQLLLQTGIREREAMHLEWDDINAARKTLKLQSKVRRWGFRLKDFEERELPLNDDLLARLMDYKRDHAGSCTLIFENDGKPDGHMLRMLKQQVRTAGLNCGKCDGCQEKSHECENWYLHKFRSTYCTKMHRNPDIDMRTLQALMGHSDLASTPRYLRPAENVQTQAAVNRMRWF